MRLYRLSEIRAVAWVAAKAIAAARSIAEEVARGEEQSGPLGGFSVSSSAIAIASGEGAAAAVGSGGAAASAAVAEGRARPRSEHLLEGLRMIASYVADHWVVAAADALGISSRDLLGISQVRKRAPPTSVGSLEAASKHGSGKPEASRPAGKASAIHSKAAGGTKQKKPAKKGSKGATGMKSLASFFGKAPSSSGSSKKRRK